MALGRGSLNETIVTELFECAKWGGVTLDGNRSFHDHVSFLCAQWRRAPPGHRFHCSLVTILSAFESVRASCTLGRSLLSEFPCLSVSLSHAAFVGSTRGPPSSGPRMRDANRQHNADRQFLSRLVHRFRPIHAVLLQPSLTIWTTSMCCRRWVLPLVL